MKIFYPIALFCAALTMVGCTSTANDDGLAKGRTASVLPEGVRLLESALEPTSTLAIPYEKFALQNGLTVILHPDHSDPLVHVDVTYHVGSGREDIGKSGFAHFFEHMMFQGSENVGDEEHFRIITEAGGTLNGTTNMDRTNYFQTVPNNQLEKMLWLEADRMGFLLPAVTQESFEVQRATVKNERAQRYENRPYGLLQERIGEALYPKGHPYSWLPIGYVSDLDRVNVNDLKAFFLRWYGPNNATLTIGGDFDRAQTLAWVAKYFGPIERGPDVEVPEKWDISLDADRYISMEDRVSLPLIFKAWPTVHARHEDEAPLDVLMSIIGTGETSLLYKNLVREGLAVQASAGHGCQELACSFTVTALPNSASGTTLADLARIIAETFAEFETRGVEADDLARMKTRTTSGMIYGLESVANKVSRIAYWETFFGTPDLIQGEIARYEAVTADDVMRVYETYLKDKPSVTMSIVPMGQLDAVAAPDTWVKPERILPDVTETSSEDLPLRSVVDRFDRSQQPPAGPNPGIDVPTLWTHTLPNGVDITGTVNTEAPTTTISVRLKTGYKDDPLDKLGLTSLTSSMLNESTSRSSNETLSNRLQLLGSSVRVSAGQNYTSLTLRTLTDNLDETLMIAEEMLFEPGFDEAEFARLKDRSLEGIRASKTKASTIASTVRPLLLYGRDNVFAWPGSGTEETVAAITLDDVKSAYAARYSAAVAEIIVVSNLGQDELTPHLSGFGNWAAEPVQETLVNPFPDLAGGTLYLIDKPDAAQSEIRITRRAMPFDATGDYYRANLLAFPLGRAFNSRINLNLREDKGYTYGASAGFGASEYAGSFTASAGVRRDVTADAIREFLKEIDGFANSGMTREELAFTQSSIGQRDARAYETPGQKLGLIGRIVTYDLDPSYVDAQRGVLEGLKVEDTQRMAADLFQTDQMITIVVGDKAEILGGLETLGMPIVELNALGLPIDGANP